jgi:transposase, IS30 family
MSMHAKLTDNTGVAVYSQEERHAITDEINLRPRIGLGLRCPLAGYRELLLNASQHSTSIH